MIATVSAKGIVTACRNGIGDTHGGKWRDHGIDECSGQSRRPGFHRVVPSGIEADPGDTAMETRTAGLT